VQEEEKRRKIPVWAWVLGCLGLLIACAVMAGLVAIVAGIIALNNVQEDLSPVVAFGEPVVTVVPLQPEATVEPPTEAATETAAPEPADAAGDVTTTPPEPTSEAQQSSPDDNSAPYAAERAAIEASVASIRELQPKEPVTPISLTPAELRQRLEDDFLQDYSPEEARQDALALSAFDFMAADFDLHSFILDLLTEQIAGYYDPETDEFVIINDDDEFDALEQIAHAHEYVHALQDQYYNLELLDDDDLDSEAAFAIQALAEGEATLVQSLFLVGGYFDMGQLLGLVEQSLNVDTAVLDSAPPVLAHELEFPYLGGLEFVQALHQQGGFDAIDAAWNNLPQSTEQILHPQRYLDGDVPKIVSLAPLTDTLGAGWELADEDTLGEFYLREYLVQQLDDDAVDQAATGWGGDRYAVYWNEAGQAPLLVLKLRWDTPADAAEFAQLYPRYPEQLLGGGAQDQADGGRCWSGNDVICLYSSDSESLVVRARDGSVSLTCVELSFYPRLHSGNAAMARSTHSSQNACSGLTNSWKRMVVLNCPTCRFWPRGRPPPVN
jgi:hypothetical protein